MATRTLKFTHWLKLMLKHGLDDDETAYNNITGAPVADVVLKLGFTKQRVYQLIEEGKLDTLHLVRADGRPCVTVITEASLNRYLDERVPFDNRQGWFSFNPN